MPNPRLDYFESGPTTRALPPQSAGLRAPTGVVRRADQRHRDHYPASPGRMSDERRGEFVDAVMALADKLPPLEIAKQTGTSTEARAVREVIKSARTALQKRAEFYVEAHAIATIAAAQNGDAKPAQWALERLAEGEDRVVDEPRKEMPPAAPTFNLGFMIGGVPAPATAASIAAIDVTPKD